jgi:predicted HicB family RNase H-like nuclease
MKNPENRKTHIIKVRINEATRLHLENMAVKRMISMSEYVRQLIERDLKNPEK